MYVQIMQTTIVNDTSHLHIIANKSERFIVKILDVHGKLAKTITHPLNSGYQHITCSLQDLTKGNYVMNAFCGSAFVKAIRFQKN